jgi:endonuclease YncB( thermonuclease family)
MRLVVLALLLFATSPALADTIAGRASVIDGDTIEIHGERIRILDIDALESRQICIDTRDNDFNPWFCGAVAANRLADWIGIRTVICETSGKDGDKRWLARCSVSAEDLAEWLAAQGWAVPYRDCKCEIIRAASENAARSSPGIIRTHFFVRSRSWNRLPTGFQLIDPKVHFVCSTLNRGIHSIALGTTSREVRKVRTPPATRLRHQNSNELHNRPSGRMLAHRAWAVKGITHTESAGFNSKLVAHVTMIGASRRGLRSAGGRHCYDRRNL